MQTDKNPSLGTLIGLGVFVLIALAAAWLRLYDLDLKPLHSDEGVNGFFLLRWATKMYYRYDPTNYHGPWLYFMTVPLIFVQKITVGQASVFALRIMPALFGVGVIALFWPLRKRLGWAGLAVLAGLMAFEPAMIYFSRTCIHEIYLVFFTVLAVAAYAVYCDHRNDWRDYESSGPWWRRATRGPTFWLTLGALGVALCYANKETALITYGALGVGIGMAWLLGAGGGSFKARWSRIWEILSEEWEGPWHDPKTSWKGMVSAVVTVAAVLFAFFYVIKSAEMVIGGTARATDEARWMFGWIITRTSEGFGRVVAAVSAAAVMGAGAFFLPPLIQNWSHWHRGLPAIRRRHLVAIGITSVVMVLLFTTVFTNPQGLVDMIRTLPIWLARGIAAEHTGHEKPFGYYWEMLTTFDIPILVLGLGGWVTALIRRERLGLFCVGWGLSIFLVYSYVSYKTPWLILNLSLPLMFSGGLFIRDIIDGIEVFVRRRVPAPDFDGVTVPPPPRASRLAGYGAVLALLLPLAPSATGPVLSRENTWHWNEIRDPEAPDRKIVHWGELAWHLNFVGYDDDRYELVYVQSLRDISGLIARLRPLLESDTHPITGERLSVHIISKDYWPIPYYVNDFDGRLGYHSGKIPDELGDVLVVRSSGARKLEGQLDGWRSEEFVLRPGVVLILYVRPEVWDPLFGGPAPDRDEGLTIPMEDQLAAGLQVTYRYGLRCDAGEVLGTGVEPTPTVSDVAEERSYGSPFCAEWIGWLRIEDEGDYAFATRSDDGSWVWVDGELLVDNGGTHGAIRRASAPVRLTEGLHRFVVRYFDAGGGAVLDVKWRPPDARGDEPIPERLLLHETSS